MNNFTEFRELGIRSARYKWYKEFLEIFDSRTKMTDVHKWFQSQPILDTIRTISPTYWVGKNGYVMNSAQVFALRFPKLKNECLHCKALVPYNVRMKSWAKFCSVKCLTSHPETRDKMVKSFKENCIEKYGVDAPMKVPAIKAKRKRTNISRYGVEHTLQVPAVRNQIKLTNNKKHGVDWYVSSPEFQDKSIATMLERYGVEYATQSSEVQERIKATNLERYGVENAGPIFTGMKIRKTFKDRFGRKHSVIGYEHLALAYFDSLESILKIETQVDKIPTYRYKCPHDKVTRTYYPDMIAFSKRKSNVIEVKSPYTLNLDLKKNLAKFKVATRECNKVGDDFWLFVFQDERSEPTIIKNPTTLKQLKDSGVVWS